MARGGEIRAVAFREGDIWVIQGIDYDVVAQTNDPLDAPVAFLKTLISTILVNQHLGRKGMEKIKPAPDRFREMFERATVELTPTGPLPSGTEKIKRPNISLRAYRQEGQEAA